MRKKEHFFSHGATTGCFSFLLLLVRGICEVEYHKSYTIVSHNLFKPINPLAFAVIGLIMIHWLTRPEYLSHIKMVID